MTNLYRPLLSYAFVSKSLNESQDWFDGLIPLFVPLIARRSGEIFDPQKIVADCKTFYGLEVSADVVAAFAPRLVKRGFLERPAKGSAELYRCVSGEPDDGEAAATAFTEQLQSIILRFQTFISGLPTLVVRNRSLDELEEMLANHLVNEELSKIDAGKLEFKKGTKEITSIIPGGSREPGKPGRYSSEDQYLCGRFVEFLHQNHPGEFDFLADISTAAMVSEVVLDLRVPENVDFKVRDLRIYLDAPFAMEALGLNGVSTKECAEFICERIKLIGAKLFIFNHSVEEMQAILKTVLDLHPADRTGLLGDTLRRGEIMPDFAQGVLRNPNNYLNTLGVVVDYFKRELYPNDHKYFDESATAGFFERLSSWSNLDARDRDVSSVAAIMRRRRGAVATNPFECGSILVSHNGLLCRLAHDFCFQHGLLSRAHVGPAVHKRQVAGLLWLSVGGEARATISRGQLLSNCAFVVRSNPDVIAAMRDKLAQVKPEYAEQLSALLSEPRCMQMAMDLSLGNEALITEANIEEAFEKVRRAAAAEVEEEAQRKLDQQKQKYENELLNRQSEITSLQERVGSLQEAKETAREKDLTTLTRWVEGANRAYSLVRRTLLIVFAVLVIALASVSAFTYFFESMLVSAFGPGAETVSRNYVVPAVIFFTIIFGFAGAVFNFAKFFPTAAARVRDWQLHRFAKINGRLDILETFSVDWEALRIRDREGKEQ